MEDRDRRADGFSFLGRISILASASTSVSAATAVGGRVGSNQKTGKCEMGKLWDHGLLTFGFRVG
jgi:hypothetical protein